MSALEAEVKEMIIDVLALEDLTPDEITADQDLFSEDGLGLDSIDALELGVEVQKRYGIKIDGQDEKLRQHFQNVGSLVALIDGHRKAEAAS